MMADDRPAKRIAPRLVAVAAALCGTLRAAESVAVAAPPAATAAKHQGAASGPIRQSSHAAPVSATSDLVERAAENRSSAPPSPQAARGALAAGEVKTRLQADESSANRPRDGLPRGASHLSTMLVSLKAVNESATSVAKSTPPGAHAFSVAHRSLLPVSAKMTA